MNKRRGSFYSKSVVLKKQFIYPIMLIAFLLFLSGQVIPLYIKNIDTDLFMSCFSYSVSATRGKQKSSILNLNHINIISSHMPIFKANEHLSKKYATRYSFIKEKEETAEKVEESLISENILELDLSSNGITFINPTDYTVDANELLNSSLSITPPDNTPRVLIVHTHSSEAYSDSPNARNDNQELSVVKVGEKIAETLNNNGIITIHDKTRNDYPSYNGSYKKSLSTVEANLQKYPSIEIVLDIHRDYVERDGNQLKPTAIFDEGKAAQIMFVVGTDSMGLYHPNWRENLSLAVKMQNVLQKTRPNLCRAINIRTERFNHHTTKGSMIIEVGTSGNSSDEAILSGEYIGNALAEILKGL